MNFKIFSLIFCLGEQISHLGMFFHLRVNAGKIQFSVRLLTLYNE